MNSYRFQLPAALVVNIDGATKEEAERKAADLWAMMLEEGRGYSVDLGRVAFGSPQIAEGVLWFDAEGEPQYLTELPDDDDDDPDDTQPYVPDPLDVADLPGTPEPWEKGQVP